MSLCIGFGCWWRCLIAGEEREMMQAKGDKMLEAKIDKALDGNFFEEPFMDRSLEEKKEVPSQTQMVLLPS